MSDPRLRLLTLALVVGSAFAFAYTALGGSLGDLTSPEALVAVGVLVAMAVAGALFARRDRRRAGTRADSTSA